jgi:predicted dehydrogenase
LRIYVKEEIGSLFLFECGKIRHELPAGEIQESEGIMMIQPVKTGIIGCGAISDAYLSTMINKFKILDVVGCYDRNPDKAQAKAQKYGIKVLSLEELLRDASIEIVVNLTQPAAHYLVNKQLLQAGKHVYTEKVLSVELEDAAELVELADQKGLYLGAAPDTFLGSATQTARFVVDSGMIGEITSCYCALTRDGEISVRAYPFTTKPGGGIGFDVGIYYITALLSILGPVKEVSGIVQTRKPVRQDYSLEHFGEPFQVECENLMAGILQFECGTIGNVLFDANSIFIIPEKPSLVLFGTMGAMYMADPNGFGGEVKVILKGNNEPFVMQQSHTFSDEYRGLGVAEMAWSMRRGRKNRANKEMAYHALEVLHGIVKSSEVKSNQVMQSTFEKMPPIPRGYSGQTYFEFIEETGIAL